MALDTTRTWHGGSRTRMRLLDGTARAVMERGLRGLTVEHILEAASLSRRTFYQYFRSKEEACLALYRQVVDELVKSIDEAIRETEEATQRLFAGLDAYLDFQQDGGDLITLLQAEAANPDSLLSPMREQALDSLVDLVDREVKASLGEALDLMIYRHLFLGLEALIIRVRNQGPLQPRDRARVSRIIKHLFIATLQAASDMPHAE